MTGASCHRPTAPRNAPAETRGKGATQSGPEAGTRRDCSTRGIRRTRSRRDLLGVASPASRGGESAEGEALYEAALGANPRFPHAHYNLARIPVAWGDLDAALAHYHETFRRGPAYPPAQNNLANLLLRLGRRAEALVHYDAAIEADSALAGAAP